MNLSVSTVSFALGLFFAISPNRAAEIWGSKRIDQLGPEQLAVFLRWYRVLGIVLCIGAALVTIDGIAFSKYHR
jgi:hypothetical protein